MALETVNRLFASVKVATNGAILARSALITGVVRNGAGDYSITTTEGIGVSEVVADCAVDGTTAGFLSCLRISATQWDVFLFDAAGLPTDRQFCFGLHRVSSSDGG